ncbi:MAG: hypothetical protein RL030_2680, partial [Pseudomonadota bacterium]
MLHGNVNQQSHRKPGLPRKVNIFQREGPVGIHRYERRTPSFAGACHL